MAEEIRPVADSPMDPEAKDVVATPEGDNEILPDEPLQPSADLAADGLIEQGGGKAKGTAVADYKKDHD